MSKKAKRRNRTSDSPRVAASSLLSDEHHSMSVRKISNGFVVSQHGYKGDKHYSHETYHEKKPKVQLTGSTKQMEKKLGDKLV